MGYLPRNAVYRKWNQPRKEMYATGNNSGREEQAKDLMFALLGSLPVWSSIFSLPFGLIMSVLNLYIPEVCNFTFDFTDGDS